MTDWISMSTKPPGPKDRHIWTWNGKTVGWIESTARINAADMKGITHWMQKTPPKPPSPPTT